MKRQEAKTLQLVQYSTGKACKYGHIGPRYSSSGVCVGCALSPEGKRRRATWASNNVDKRRDQSRGYYRRKYLPAPTRPEPTYCECCHQPCSRLRLDHDHVTGLFRGWLCHKCNVGIGALGDTAAGVHNAVVYFAGVESNHASQTNSKKAK